MFLMNFKCRPCKLNEQVLLFTICPRLCERCCSDWWFLLWWKQLLYLYLPCAVSVPAGLVCPVSIREYVLPCFLWPYARGCCRQREASDTFTHSTCKQQCEGVCVWVCTVEIWAEDHYLTPSKFIEIWGVWEGTAWTGIVWPSQTFPTQTWAWLLLRSKKSETEKAARLLADTLPHFLLLHVAYSCPRPPTSGRVMPADVLCIVLQHKNLQMLFITAICSLTLKRSFQFVSFLREQRKLAPTPVWVNVNG